MIINYISSSVIIERIFDEYNIQSSDFVTRLAKWTLNVLREVNVKQLYRLTNIISEIDDYKCQLPEFVNRVYGIKINGVEAELDISNETVKQRYSNTPNLIVSFSGEIFPSNDNDIYTMIENDNTIIGLEELSKLKYWNFKKTEYKFSIRNGWIHTDVKEGTCEILAGSIPYEYNTELDILFPIIPDDENLINAIIQYSLKNMLMRGYKHSILSLEKNNEFVNPAIAYETFKRKARNSCNSLSVSAKNKLSEMLITNII